MYIVCVWFKYSSELRILSVRPWAVFSALLTCSSCCLASSGCGLLACDVSRWVWSSGCGYLVGGVELAGGLACSFRGWLAGWLALYPSAPDGGVCLSLCEVRVCVRLGD